MMTGTSGGQNMSCPECGGMMELRLGRWDCSRCGHVIEPDKPVGIDVGSPADSVNRAKLIRRADDPVPMSGDSSKLESRLHLMKQAQPYSLAVRLSCLGGQLLVVAVSHMYILMRGEVGSWLESGQIGLRLALQAVYVLLICVGLFWRELPTKYFALALNILVFIGLFAMVLMQYGLLPRPDSFYNSIFPSMPEWYWVVLLFLHTSLMFVIFTVIRQDLESRVSPGDGR
ncbi:MAG: hypothetical protein H7A35_14215 [Planctomycetales bacterium]|nr:MAG: hypothetical protein H7A35_14215 [Planctomycetales bacterium]